MESSELCRLKAEEMELMARVVSFGKDRDYCKEMARSWRAREAEALAAERVSSARRGQAPPTHRPHA